MAKFGIQFLPTEVLLQILSEMQDLNTLYAAVCTCSRLAEVFATSSTEILEKVIRQSLSIELRECPRRAAILSSLKTLGSLYIKGVSFASGMPGMIERFQEVHKDDQPRLGDGVPRMRRELRYSAGPRYVLVVAHRIRRLEDVVLTHMMERIDGIEMSYPMDPEFSFDFDWRTQTLEVMAEQYPPSISFKASTHEPPSWIERERVTRALWQMMTVWDLHMTLGARIDIGDDFKGYVRAVQVELDAELFYDVRELPGWLDCGSWAVGDLGGDAFDCVYDTLKHILGRSPTEFFCGRLSTRTHFRADNALSAYAGKVHAKAWSYSPEPRQKEQRVTILEELFCNKGNIAEAFYHIKYCHHDVSGSMCKPDFRLFSLLGLSVWDTGRLRTLGLCEIPHTHPGQDEFPSPIENNPDGFEGMFNSGQLAVWRSLFMAELQRRQDEGRRRLSPGALQMLMYWQKHHGWKGDLTPLVSTDAPMDLPRWCRYCPRARWAAHYVDDCWLRANDRATMFLDMNDNSAAARERVDHNIAVDDRMTDLEVFYDDHVADIVWDVDHGWVEGPFPFCYRQGHPCCCRRLCGCRHAFAKKCEREAAEPVRKMRGANRRRHH